MQKKQTIENPECLDFNSDKAKTAPGGQSHNVGELSHSVRGGSGKMTSGLGVPPSSSSVRPHKAKPKLSKVFFVCLFVCLSCCCCCCCFLTRKRSNQ